MRRRLGNMEAALQLTRRIAPLTVATVVRLRGAPPPDRLREVLDVLQQRHALLRSRIVTGRGGPWFESSDDVGRIPLDVVPRRDGNHWQEIAQQTLNRHLDVEHGPPITCTYLEDPERSEADLVFAFDHAVMDAVSAGRMSEQLLGLAAGTVQPADIPSMAESLPAPIDDLLPPRLQGVSRLAPLSRYLARQLADEVAYRRAVRDQAAPIQPVATCRVVSRVLDPDLTADLVRRARARRLTMNSVVSAALIAATRDRLHHGQSLPVRALAFADLRPYLEPPPPPDVLGCYIAMLRQTLAVGPDDDVWTIAAAFQDAMRRSLDQDEHLLAAGLARRLMAMIVVTKRMRLGTTAVSYTGPIPLAERHGDIEVTGVHGFISNNRLGPVTTAMVSIFGGRLVWNFVFLDTDLDPRTAEQIADTALMSGSAEAV